MTVYDFSSGFNLLNQGINSLGEALNNRTNAQGYSDIGAAMQRGDIQGAAARAWAMGNADLALKLQMGAYSQGGGYQPLDSSGAPQPATLKPTTVPGAPSTVTAGPSTGTSGPRAEGAYTSNPFTNTLIRQESGGDPKIVSRTDVDSHGLTLAQGGNPTEIAQGLFQIQNHPGGTWSIYAPKAGVDLSQYPTPASAPPDVQHRVAQQIPIGQWGHDTKKILTQKFGPLDPRMTLGDLEARFGPAAVTAATGGGPSAAAPAAPAAPATVPAAPAAAPGPQAAAPAAPAPPQMAQAASQPLSAPAGPVAPQPLSPPLPRLAQAAGGGGPGVLGSMLGINPAQAGELQPQPQPPPAPVNAPLPPARPPGIAAPATGNALQPIVQALQAGRLTMRDLLVNYQRFGLPDPQQPQNQPIWAALASAATGGGPGIGAQTAVTPPQTPPPPQPTVNAPLPPVRPQMPAAPTAGGPQPWQPGQGFQPRQAGMPGIPLNAPEQGVDALARALATNLPGAPTPQQQAAAAANPPLGGFNLGTLLGARPPGSEAAAQPFAGATATAETTQTAPLPPRRPDFGRPPPEMSTAGPGFGEGQDPTSAIREATRDSGPGQPIVNAPYPPVRPADIGKPFPVKPPPAPPPPPPTVPASIQPKSSRVPTPQGPYGPPGGPGSAFARDFGPGAGQMWGPSGGVMASGRGGITPNYLGGPTPQGVTPQAIAAAQNAFRLPGPGGTTPAALPPGAAPARGGLGAALSGLGGGLLNVLSMTPPQGVPGMNTPAQFLQGGMNAPLPPPPWLRAPQPGMVPGGGTLPTIQTGAGAPQPGPAAQPAAAPVAGAPAQPAGAVDPLDAQIAQATAVANSRRALAAQNAYWRPDLAKIYTAEADKYQELANNLIQKKAEAGIKVGETAVTTSADMAKDQFKGLNTAYQDVTGQGGAKGLLKNVYQMKANLDQALVGYGGAQGVVNAIGGYLGAMDLGPKTALMNTQQLQDLSTQEVLQLAKTLVGRNRLTNKDVQLLQQGMLNPAQQKEVISAMLDMAAERAMDTINTHNDTVERFANAYKGTPYAESARSQFTIDKASLPKPEDFKPLAPEGKGGANAPVHVASPAEAMKLPPGTPIILPDGRTGTVPARQ